MRTTSMLILLGMLALAGCNDAPREEPAVKTEVPQAVDDRDQWQKPDALLALMGDLHGKQVADLFAGDGYFTFQLIKAGANVIAIVSDPQQEHSLERKKKDAGLGDDRLEIRIAPANGSGLKAGEADLGLIVHSFNRIPDRMNYLLDVRNGLKDPKQLFVVEWQNRPTPVGPPQAERIATEQIMEDLGMAGFSGVGAMADRMPYQVVLMAMDQMDMSEDELEHLMEGKEVIGM